jgi:hypothetical protein
VVVVAIVVSLPRLMQPPLCENRFIGESIMKQDDKRLVCCKMKETNNSRHSIVTQPRTTSHNTN